MEKKEQIKNENKEPKRFSFSATYWFLVNKLFNRRQINKELVEWLGLCFNAPLEAIKTELTTDQAKENITDLINDLNSFGIPDNGTDKNQRFFILRTSTVYPEFRYRLAKFLMSDDENSLNQCYLMRIRNQITDQLKIKINEACKTNKLCSTDNNPDKVIHDIVEKLCSYDLASANNLKNRIQTINSKDPYYAYTLLTIVSLFGELRGDEVKPHKNKSEKAIDPSDAAKEFDKLVTLLSEEVKTDAELLRTNIISDYKGAEVLFNYEWENFIESRGKRTGTLSKIRLEKILKYALAVHKEKQKLFNINNNSHEAIEICTASINAAKYENRLEDISVCLYILRLYNAIAIDYWKKKDQMNFSYYFDEGKKYLGKILPLVSVLDSNDMSKDAINNRNLLKMQIEQEIPETINFLHQEGIYYSFTHQYKASINVYYKYINELKTREKNYSGDYREHIKWLINSAENDLAFVMMKAYDLSYAEKFFEHTLKNRKSLIIENKERKLSLVYTNLAQIKNIINDFDEALEYIEKAYDTRMKLYDDEKLGASSPVLSLTTYAHIYIRRAVQKIDTRNEDLKTAKQKLDLALKLYDKTPKADRLLCNKSYIKTLILIGVIKNIENMIDSKSEPDNGISYLEAAAQFNKKLFTDNSGEIFNIPFIEYKINIQLLITEIKIKQFMNTKPTKKHEAEAAADSALSELGKELKPYCRDFLKKLKTLEKENKPCSWQNIELNSFSPLLQCTIYIILIIMRLNESNKHKSINDDPDTAMLIQKLIDRARKGADLLCSQTHDDYENNNDKAFKTLKKFTDNLAPFTNPQTEFYSISYLMLL